MKFAIFAVLIMGISLSCDPNRVYEKNVDFDNRNWTVTEQPSFDFEIVDGAKKYNLFVNIRNEVGYPNANIYFTWVLKDSTDKILKQQLVSEFLFEQKTGKPFGNTVLGDIYDHRFPILKDYTFPGPGQYQVSYEQFMRADTLRGILSVGLRVEESAPE